MLEFGVSRTSQISLIGLSSPRTSAVALNELLTEDELSEEGALLLLAEGLWRVSPLPALVKEEIERVLLHRPDAGGRLRRRVDQARVEPPRDVELRPCPARTAQADSLARRDSTLARTMNR